MLVVVVCDPVYRWTEFKVCLTHPLEYIFGKSLLVPPSGSSDGYYSSNSKDILDSPVCQGCFN